MKAEPYAEVANVMAQVGRDDLNLVEGANIATAKAPAGAISPAVLSKVGNVDGAAGTSIASTPGCQPSIPISVRREPCSWTVSDGMLSPSQNGGKFGLKAAFAFAIFLLIAALGCAPALADVNPEVFRKFTEAIVTNHLVGQRSTRCIGYETVEEDANHIKVFVHEIHEGTCPGDKNTYPHILTLIYRKKDKAILLDREDGAGYRVLDNAHASGPSADPAQPAYKDGHTDRMKWELWISQQAGDIHDGAMFWAAQRSLPKPASCSQDDKSSVWRDACRRAQIMLAPYDVRRNTEPQYRFGWNAPVDLQKPILPLANQAQNCRVYNNETQRLQCLDAAPNRAIDRQQPMGPIQAGMPPPQPLTPQAVPQISKTLADPTADGSEQSPDALTAQGQSPQERQREAVKPILKEAWPARASLEYGLLAVVMVAIMAFHMWRHVAYEKAPETRRPPNNSGVSSGLTGCVFGILGIFTIGLIFVPLAAIFTLVGIVRSTVNFSILGIALSLLSAYLTISAAAASPTIWIALGLTAAIASH